VSAVSTAAVVVGGLVVPASVALLLAPLAASGGIGWELAEGCAVGVALLAAEVVGVHQLGKRLRVKKRADLLAARNARIAAYRAGDVLDSAAL
jgi:hypothetical protein